MCDRRIPIRVLLTNDVSVQDDFRMIPRRAPKEKKKWSFPYAKKSHPDDLSHLAQHHSHLQSRDGYLQSFIVDIGGALLLIRRQMVFVGAYLFDPFDTAELTVVNRAIDMLYDTNMINHRDVVAIYFVDIKYPCEEERKSGVIKEAIRELSYLCLIPEWDDTQERMLRNACLRAMNQANIKHFQSKQ